MLSQTKDRQAPGWIEKDRSDNFGHTTWGVRRDRPVSPLRRTWAGNAMAPDLSQLSASQAVDVSRLSDLDLITAVGARGEDAFAELFRRHSPSVTAATRMILGNRAECDDVVAEVFVGIWVA